MLRTLCDQRQGGYKAIKKINRPPIMANITDYGCFTNDASSPFLLPLIA